MATVHWSVRVQASLDALAEYVALTSRQYAARITTRFYEASLPLSDFPRMGRVLPELGRDNIRELIVGNHRMIYMIDGDDVVVVALELASRDLLRLISDEPWSQP